MRSFVIRLVVLLGLIFSARTAALKPMAVRKAMRSPDAAKRNPGEFTHDSKPSGLGEAVSRPLSGRRESSHSVPSSLTRKKRGLNPTLFFISNFCFFLLSILFSGNSYAATAPTYTAPTLAATVTMPGIIYYGGTVSDTTALSSVVLQITKPNGAVVTAFTDTTVAGLTSKSLAGYYFNSADVNYANAPGTYALKVITTNSSGFVSNLTSTVAVIAAAPVTPPTYTSATLASTVTMPGIIYYGGAVSDTTALSSVVLRVTKPNGAVVTAFTDTTVAGLTSKSLAGYYFNSADVNYANAPGTYSLQLTTTNSRGLSAIINASVTVNSLPVTPPTYTSATLASTVTMPGIIYYGGTVSDTTALSSVVLRITKPNGAVVTAFTDTTVAGLTSKSLAGYYFNSADVNYANAPGTYSLQLTTTNSRGLSAIINASVLVATAVATSALTLTPTSARLDVLQTFTLTGSGFSASTTYAVQDCTNEAPNASYPMVTGTAITFRCTPTLPGEQRVSVNNAILAGVTVNVDHPARLGNAASRGIPSSHGVSLFNGNVHLEATDMTVPGKGVSFALTRSYNSYSWDYEAARGSVSNAAPWRFNWDLQMGYVTDPVTNTTNTNQVWVQREDGSGESFFKDATDGNWYPMDQGNFNTLKLDSPVVGQTTLLTREGLKYVFQNRAAGAQLIGIFDHDGNGLTITRNVSGRVGTVTDALNRVYTFTYDVNGNLFRVTDFANRFVEYTWELSVAPQVGVRLKTVRDVLGGITTYNYALQTSYLTQNKPTDQTLLTSIVDPNGNRAATPYAARTYTYTDTVYGNWGAASVADALSSSWAFTYCAKQQNGTCSTDPTAAVSFETITTPPLGATSVARFDTGGRLIEQVDANAKLSKTTPMPLAGLTSRIFNLAALPTAKQSALGVAGNFSTSYAYTPDNAGNLATLTDAENAITTRGWLSGTPQAATLLANNLHRVSQFTSATGGIHGFTYDNVGKVLSYTPPALPAGGVATQLTYDPAGQVTSVTDGLGKTSSRVYDANGNLVTMTGPDALPVQNTYDNLGRVLTSTDKRGNLTTNTWDAAGNLLTVKDALNGTVTYVYDANGNRTQMTDALGHTTFYGYDALNRLIGEVKYNGLQQLTTAYNYDVLGRTIATVNANNHADSTAYDGVGNVLSRANALAFTTQYLYDADNRVTRTTDPEGRVTDTTYDKVGRVKTVTTAAGTTSYVYDGDGRMTSSTDPRGKVTGYAYDAASRLIALTDANGQVTHATYDANGNMLTVVDPNGKTTTYTYDVLNRPLTRTDANGQQWVTTYDQNGNVKTSTAPGNKVTTYTYDALDRVTQVVYPDASVVSYTFDANGNRLTMVDSTGTTRYTYDALDRMSSKTDPQGKVVSYSYDGIGNVTTLGYPGGQTVSYTYDAGERLTSLTDWLGKTTTYTLNRSGQVSATLFGNNSRAEMLYDTAGRMSSLINKNVAGAIISSHGLTLDANGNITTSTQQLPLQPSLTNINRAFTYDPANRLASFNGGAVTHDVAGRITALAGDIYSYNDRDQITAITGTQAASYTYNGEGHRVSSNLNGQLTRFVIDSNRGLPEVLAETDSAGVVLRNYVYGYGLVEQIDSANVAHYYHYDPTGSTLALSNAAGVVTDSYAYTPYGETTASGTTVNPFRYVGKLGVMDDGNGMQYMRARYYRPDVARFMSLDQLSGSADKPQSLNRYAYALGNPVMGVDPSGLAVFSEARKRIERRKSIIKRRKSIAASNRRYANNKRFTNAVSSLEELVSIENQKISQVSGLLEFGRNKGNGGWVSGVTKEGRVIKQGTKVLSAAGNVLTVLDGALKVASGQGSAAGQAANVGFSIVTGSSVLNVGASVADIALGTFGIHTQASNIMGSLQEAAFDPVVRDKLADKGVENAVADRTIECVVDGSSCGMNFAEHIIFVIGNSF